MPFAQTMIKCCSCGKLLDIYFHGDNPTKTPFGHVLGISNKFYTCICPSCNSEIQLGNGCVGWVDEIPVNSTIAKLHEK